MRTLIPVKNAWSITVLSPAQEQTGQSQKKTKQFSYYVCFSTLLCVFIFILLSSRPAVVRPSIGHPLTLLKVK